MTLPCTWRPRAERGLAASIAIPVMRPRAWHEDYSDIVITRNSGRSQTVNIDDALTELAQRTAALHQSTAIAAVNAQRRAQAEPDVEFTQSAFEGWVKHHATQHKWPLRAWEQGRSRCLAACTDLAYDACSPK